MGRPRKAPSRIVTFNLPISLAEDIDDLGLKNRSEWAAKVFRDHLNQRAEDADLKAAEREVMADPAARIGDIPTKQLAAATLARIPPFDRDLATDEKISNTRLRNLLRDFLKRRMD